MALDHYDQLELLLELVEAKTLLGDLSGTESLVAKLMDSIASIKESLLEDYDEMEEALLMSTIDDNFVA
jgi:hypothetical protein